MSKADNSRRGITGEIYHGELPPSPLDYAKVIEWLWQNPGRKSQEMPEDFKPTFYDAIDRMGLWRMAQLMEERYAEE